MANSILNDRQGPDWPLGFIKVVTPGTPVSIMSLVDPNNYNAPNTPTSANSNEYTVRAQQIMFMGWKPGASTGWVANAGNIYVLRKGSGSSNYADSGVLVQVVAPGTSFYLASAPQVTDVFGPYRYYIDADNANDGCQVCLLIF